MTSMGLGLHPFSFNATWVPSPQSISRLLPLHLAIMEVSHLYGRGIIPPVPNKHISNISVPHLFLSTLEIITQIVLNNQEEAGKVL